MNLTQKFDYVFRSTIDVELCQSVGGDEQIVRSARVSTGRDLEPIDDQTTSGLINYLMKHRHGTPFEHASMTFVVRAPLFVWREWHRHRIGFSYNEESARYKTLAPEFYVPDQDRPMMKVEGWKPGRPKFSRLHDRQAYDVIVGEMEEGYRVEYERYLRLLDRQIDPGLARVNLPVGIYSTCWVTCNPRSLMSFLSLRTHDLEAAFVSYPLWEIELAAKACERIFSAGWPVTHDAFTKNGRVAP